MMCLLFLHYCLRIFYECSVVSFTTYHVPVLIASMHAYWLLDIVLLVWCALVTLYNASCTLLYQFHFMRYCLCYHELLIF